MSLTLIKLQIHVTSYYKLLNEITLLLHLLIISPLSFFYWHLFFGQPMGDQDHDDHGVCNTRLELGIGLDNFVHKSKISHHQQHKKTNKSLICLDLSFPFHEIGCKTEEGSSSKTINNGHEDQERQSDTSNNMNNDDNNNGGGNVRKKLRLTKEQSIILEDSFKQHTTLNTAQKQALSEKLKLKPRQVEVWFQNRRARTKLKKTEGDCEFLKKCCENLSEENRRLKKELQDLLSKPSTISTPFFVQLQKEAAAAKLSSMKDQWRQQWQWQRLEM